MALNPLFYLRFSFQQQHNNEREKKKRIHLQLLLSILVFCSIDSK